MTKTVKYTMVVGAFKGFGDPTEAVLHVQGTTLEKAYQRACAKLLVEIDWEETEDVSYWPIAVFEGHLDLVPMKDIMGEFGYSPERPLNDTQD